MSDDAALQKMLDAAIAGDRRSLADLLEATGSRVRARIEPKIPMAMRSLLEADDVMQVTYLEAVLRIKSFSTGGVQGFVAWLTRLAENNLIDAVRSLEAAKRFDPRKRVSPNRDESSSALINMLGATLTTPSKVAAIGEAGAMLEVALRALPPDYEKVVREFDLEGKPMAEVAAGLKKTEGAAYMLRARAHDRLKEILGSDSRFFSKPA